MATLAEILRGYKPPTESALADPIKEHFRTLPQQIETNQRAMDKTMAGMDKTDVMGRPNPNYYPEAMQEFTQNYAPNVLGATKAIMPRKEAISNIFDKIMNVFGKGQKIPQMPEGVVFENLHPIIQQRIKEGLIPPGDAQWMSDYANTPGIGLVETGTGAFKDQSEKMQNLVRRMEAGEVSIPKHWQGVGGVNVGGNSAGSY
jgi:hypothetical protein